MSASASSLDFFTFARRYQRAAFQIAHGILRDEAAADKITLEVLARARRRLERGADPASNVVWIYHASLRFARRYYWRASTPALRRRLGEQSRCRPGGFALFDFVDALARQPIKISQHDCELIALRHVLGLSLVHIGQLMRMHPYEISNRLAWSLERLKEMKPHEDPLAAQHEFVRV